MNIDFFREVTHNRVPLDFIAANQALNGKQIDVLITNKSTGKPHYFQPMLENWIDTIIASYSVPMFTLKTSIPSI